ncbi:hypothetical protein TRFO_32638 [Tritrichomonas foetus]|uniref:Uncharacterized protein n=1 Tax=Tritrichomonas foetus TaxID=1144522 RepID=A0A1J4JT16_9EUKA|nr:hypothetical protein TRFO_32638 [Tritrichomonas foetus]|eukprot:OHT00662.1 hypothetical protein TRFO_32638 [Tritrichomonas foetus]
MIKIYVITIKKRRYRMNHAIPEMGADNEDYYNDADANNIYPEEEEIYGGWSVELMEQFLALTTNKDRLEFVKQIMAINDDDYNFKHTATFLVDFHLGNAAFCLDSNFNAEQSFFVCQSIAILLDDCISTASSSTEEGSINFDQLRDALAHKFQELFQQSAPEFNLHQVESILAYIMSTFLKPIRLIIRQFQQEPYTLQILEIRKIFAPIRPIPLSQFIEEAPIHEHEFPLSMRPEKIDLQKIPEEFEKYQNEMKEVAEKRLAELNKRIEELNALLESE